MEKIFLGYIYKITNQINGKVYIGQTSKIDPTKRWNEHRHAVIDPDQRERPLYRAMRKYGIDNFKFEVIETVYEEDHTTLNQREHKTKTCFLHKITQNKTYHFEYSKKTITFARWRNRFNKKHIQE